MTMNKSSYIEYLDPTGVIADAKLVVRTLGDLKGRRLAFVNNGWRSFTKIGARMEETLRRQYGLDRMQAYSVPTAGPPPPEMFDRIFQDCDAAVVGLAN